MALSQGQIVDLFKRIHLFRDVDDQKLNMAANVLAINPLSTATYQPNQSIFRQDDDSDFFYIISDGQVSLSCLPNNAHPTGKLGTLDDGDYFGEEVLESNWPRQVSAEATTETTLLRISVDDFIEILKIIPTLGQRLQLILNSSRLLMRIDFSWREENEAIRFVSRRHMIVLLRMLLAPVAAGLLFVPATGLLDVALNLLITQVIFIITILACLAWLVWNYVDWTNDYYVITNQRVVFQEKIVLLYESRQESPLWYVQSTLIHRSQLAIWFGFGNVEIRTLYGTILFRDIPMPDQVSAFIQQQQMRAQFQQRRMGIKEIRDYLDNRLKTGPERPPLPMAKSPPPKPDPFQAFISTVFHLRYVSGKTIIYRTHWWNLVQRTWLPSLLLFGLVMVFLFSALSRFSAISAQATCGVLFLLTAILLGWWGYQYWDWHNDIYLITPDQVVDLYKKPFGQEDRMAAPIKNIQSISYKRLGLTGQFLNFGTVYIRVGDRQLTFDDVYKPSDVQRELFHALAKAKADEKKKEAEDRKKELGDWYDAFTKVQQDSSRTGLS